MPSRSGDGTEAPRSLGVITYLAQDHHSSYAGRNSLEMLQRSVESLFKYYNRRAHDDVIFFHTGVNASSQRKVLALCNGARARFLRLPPHHFELPPDVPPASTWAQTNAFSTGYRHMIRFYTLGIWEVVAAEGYSFVMRSALGGISPRSQLSRLPEPRAGRPMYLTPPAPFVEPCHNSYGPLDSGRGFIAVVADRI